MGAGEREKRELEVGRRDGGRGGFVSRGGRGGGWAEELITDSIMLPEKWNPLYTQRKINCYVQKLSEAFTTAVAIVSQSH